MSFPAISKVRLEALEIVEVDVNDLIGHRAKINKSDYWRVEGRVIKVNEQKIEVNLSNSIHGVETNAWITVIDNNGSEHEDTLFVNPE